MASDILQFIIYAVVVTGLAWPLGLYMAKLYSGERTFLSPILQPIENGFYRLSGIDPDCGQHWTRYALSVLTFSFFCFLVLYAILRLQQFLPFNPQGFPGLSPDLAFNTTVSFMTNTNWQAYGGETTMSYFSQMVGLTVQNFVSAAAGMAVCAAIIRGFFTREQRLIGNFWVDLTRTVLYLLLPLSIVGGLVLVFLGVPQNLLHYVDANTLQGAKQMIAQGPVASQLIIKQLGTNGGGFFNANSAMPYENPTPLTNLVEIVSILIIPAAFCFMFGRMVRDRRQGLAIFAAMGILFLGALALTYAPEIHGNPLFAHLPIDQAAGNMEGKEVRFGVGNSALWATATTAASNGSVNSMHDSFMPLSMLAPMLQMQTGEVIFGGVGSGFYGMLAFVVLTVFLAGLMVGRTPEYLGKKIEAKEVTLSVIAFLVMPLGVLGVRSACRRAAGIAFLAVQPRSPRPVGNPLRLFVGDREQRLGLRRLQCQRALSQHYAGNRHAAGPFRLHRADARGSRLARRQEDDTGLGRHVSDPYAALRRAAYRRHPHYRWPDLLPGPGAGADRRAFRDARRPDLLRC